MKIYLDTIGCRLNQAEIERMARQFRAAGHTLVARAAEADLAVVNTCAVTAKAAADSRQRIRQLARAGVPRVVATGCWATLEPAQAAALPAVHQVVPNQAKELLVPQVLGAPPHAFDLEPLAREPIPGRRGRTRAFIKVQDGCDNRCTFCITTVARGPGRSQPLAAVLDDVWAAQRGGVQEVVLTGVHLGSWGRDLSPPQRLHDLVRAVLRHTDIPRVRLSSLEPWDLDDAFFALWENPRLAPHLHLPLQSGSAAVLRRMARKTTPQAFARLVAAARRAIPDVAITTDLIAGFPGESEAEFAETLAFVQAMDFAGGHVFTYSPRPGTAAARMPDQVPLPLRRERNAALRAVLAASAARYRRAFVGRTLQVLWESARPHPEGGFVLRGLSGNYLRVEAQAPADFHNRFLRVTIVAVTEDGLRGEIVNAPSPSGG